MYIDLEDDERVDLLVSLSHRMGLSADEVLAMYLVLDDGVFYLFDLLQGRSVKFPSLRSFQHGLASLGGFKIQKLRKSHYNINGEVSYRESIKKGDIVTVSGVDVVSFGTPKVILGETYILCKNKEN